MSQKFVLIFLTMSVMFACKSDHTKGLESLDLMSKGIPIKIMAPVGSEVLSEDFGVMKDVTIKKGDDFYLQILASNAMTTDKTAIINGQKSDVQNAPYFSKFIQEDADGFIYEKQIDSSKINYDFRYVKLQGDREYMFQTGLIGSYSLEDVKRMYQAVQ